MLRLFSATHAALVASPLAIVCALACTPVGGPDFDSGVPSIAKRAPSEPPAPSPQVVRREGQVRYTIAHGGSLLDVANLYKIHHHEIIALNPEIEPKQPLPVGSEVVVYERGEHKSESLGLPHDGRIAAAMPLPDGPGRRITAQRWKTWGTRHTVLELDRIFAAWAEQHRDAPKVLVSNLSARHGGPLEPHKTHQSGRDVDLGYVQKGSGASDWQHVTRKNLDAARTWSLLRLIVSSADVEVIYMDRSLQRVLLDHALRHGTVRKNRLAYWLEVAKGERQGGPLIKHVPGHADHFHVRLACPSDEPRCES
jgi:murein endopeptidase